MIACRRWRCPACGFFGRGALRRARLAADRLHVNWARALATSSRRDRADANGLISVVDCRPLLTDEQRAALVAALGPNAEMDLRDHLNAEVERAKQIIALQEYGTADVVAETVGEMSYEEQSEMIGDPIANAILRETDGEEKW